VIDFNRDFAELTKMEKGRRLGSRLDELAFGPLSGV
jgi:hypothetical protein